MLAERPARNGEEVVPYRLEAFRGQVTPGRDPVAVGPLVVTGGQYERIGERAVQPRQVGEPDVGTGAGSVLDVPGVQHHPDAGSALIASTRAGKTSRCALPYGESPMSANVVAESAPAAAEPPVNGTNSETATVAAATSRDIGRMP